MRISDWSSDVCSSDLPAFARALDRVGYPEPRIRARGYGTLLRTIIGQQVSVAAASSIWNKLEAAVGEGLHPAANIAAPDEMLRQAGVRLAGLGLLITHDPQIGRAHV